MIKFTRIEALLKNGGAIDDFEVFTSIDAQKIVQLVEVTTKSFLERVRGKNLLEKIEIDTPIGSIKYQFPDLDNANVKLWIWSICITLRNVSLSELMVAFLCLLHESAMVIMSSRLYLITAFM